MGATRDTLAARSELLFRARGFFRQRGFIEIEAPVLVRAPAPELHIEAVAAAGGFLRTSPELHLKRLLAAGHERVYTLGPCFRAGEVGPQHSVEFTMLEWYRAPGDLDAIAADLEALVVELAGPSIQRDGRVVDLAPPWPRARVPDLFAEHAGIELAGDESAADLAARAGAAGHAIGAATAWDDIFFTVWLEAVEPAIAAADRPMLVCDWPLPLAALARPRPGDPRWAERFELYIGGLELANAFGELTDAAEQRRRFTAERAERRRRGKADYPLDERFLAALAAGMPPAGGIALGFDRLVMLILGAGTIDEVQPFAGDEV
jgi:lysyl-tRNA synthetase class 2